MKNIKIGGTKTRVFFWTLVALVMYCVAEINVPGMPDIVRKESHLIDSRMDWNDYRNYAAGRDIYAENPKIDEALNRARRLSRGEDVRLFDWIDTVMGAYIRPANDIDAYGKNTYQAMPHEFLAKGQGDCEEYALMGYLMLKRAGYEAYYGTGYVIDRMTGKRVGHAVALVRWQEEVYVLDSYGESGTLERFLTNSKGRIYGYGDENGYYRWGTGPMPL